MASNNNNTGTVDPTHPWDPRILFRTNKFSNFRGVPFPQEDNTTPNFNLSDLWSSRAFTDLTANKNLDEVRVTSGKRRNNRFNGDVVSTIPKVSLNAPTMDINKLQPMQVNTPFNPLPKESNFDWVGAANSIAPYASNVINSFRRPAQVPSPNLASSVTLNRVNFDNDRNEALRGESTGNLWADRNLDSNAAAAIRAHNRATTLDQFSKVNQEENNQNSNIANTQANLNSQIQQANLLKIDNMNANIADRFNTIQTQQSQNIANAADKYMAIQNEKAKDNLEKQRINLTYQTYNRDGVASRHTNLLNSDYNTYIENAEKEYYKNKYKNGYKFGGSMKKLSDINTKTMMNALNKK